MFLLLCFLLSYIRSRNACDTYKQLLSDALNQLKALHKAGVMSNNQCNQFDRLVKAVEQVKSRPIWTPNTTRQQQAELVEQLKKELNKVLIRICCCCYCCCCRFFFGKQNEYVNYNEMGEI